ncbi:sugar efflux transporter B [Klebsiella pneumoniae]|uniref:Sugar efflux transporter B n=1 Tax=Klebsiella pneumoniae TaxID=573 RepID=A0A447RLD1_KLEPN|nr:sugar efflux transporter B [Klebsiella pneumoniae]
MENRSAALPRRGVRCHLFRLLNRRLSDGHCRGAANPDPEPVSDQRSARPPGDGRFLFYRQRGYWYSGQSVPRWPLRPSGRSQAADCRLLSAGGCWPAYSLPGTATISFCCSSAFFSSSFGSTANPQMFALAREHADRTGREAVMFSSILRAQVSLAWVIGPPAGLRPGDGVWFYRDVSQRRGGVYRLRDHGLAILAQHAQRKPGSDRPAGSSAHAPPRCACCCSASAPDVGY